MDINAFSLAGSVALVTGAAGGIGARVALGLAEFGASVGILDVAGSDLASTTEAIAAIGGTSESVFVDVTDGDALTAAVARVQNRLGPLKHAVNCAGINNQIPAESMTRAQWQKMLDINLTGIFLSCQVEGVAMIANGGGSIVNIGSVSAHIANRGLDQVHYNAAKAGVLQLTKSLGLEWVAEGVRVNSVSPGYTATPMALSPEVWPLVEGLQKDIPMARLAKPSELVGPIVFLLSDAASYVTSVDLLVDGGAVAW
ncbi:SDR family oxidoreductase [Cryobacterium suzukii]|uniref:SDR family oxidoreductase n=1 Tax=Cryobacterium suzukii TaxID=1259198 RepID=A0A4R9AI89_9MICO|nr:SDR family oxidoreductase [Cryobacterium suzukii]TFD62172.1 SDR family oxidoreductase [Cryobacterium suzukii]